MIYKIRHYKIKCDHLNCLNEKIISCEEVSTDNLSGMNKILTGDLNCDLIVEAIRKAGWKASQKIDSSFETSIANIKCRDHQ